MPVASDSREGRKTPDISLGVTSHVMQCTKEGNPFFFLPFNVFNSQMIKKSVCVCSIETIVTYKGVCYFRRALYFVYISLFYNN